MATVHKTDSRVIDPRGCPGGEHMSSPRSRTLALSPFSNIATAARQYFGNANHLPRFALPQACNVPNSVRFQVSRS